MVLNTVFICTNIVWEVCGICPYNSYNTEILEIFIIFVTFNLISRNYTHIKSEHKLIKVYIVYAVTVHPMIAKWLSCSLYSNTACQST